MAHPLMRLDGTIAFPVFTPHFLPGGFFPEIADNRSILYNYTRNGLNRLILAKIGNND